MQVCNFSLNWALWGPWDRLFSIEWRCLTIDSYPALPYRERQFCFIHSNSTCILEWRRSWRYRRGCNCPPEQSTKWTSFRPSRGESQWHSWYHSFLGRGLWLASRRNGGRAAVGPGPLRGKANLEAGEGVGGWRLVEVEPPPLPEKKRDGSGIKKMEVKNWARKWR